MFVGEKCQKVVGGERKETEGTGNQQGGRKGRRIKAGEVKEPPPSWVLNPEY